MIISNQGTITPGAEARADASRGLREQIGVQSLLFAVRGVATLLYVAAGISFDTVGRVPLANGLHAVGVVMMLTFFAAAIAVRRATTWRDVQRIESASVYAVAAGGLLASYLLGGVEWFGPFTLILPMLAAAFMRDRRAAIGAASLVLGGFLVTTLLQAAGAIPDMSPFRGGGSPSEGRYLAASIIFLTIAFANFLTATWIMSFLARHQQRLLEAASDEAAAARAELEMLNAELECRVAGKTREIEERSRELAVMAELGKIVNASLNVQHVYLEFMREARKLIAFDQASIAVYNEDGTRLRLLHTRYLDGDFVGDPHEIDASTSVQAATEPRLIEDIATAGDFRERSYLLSHGAACGITVPVASKGVLLGSFNVVSNTAGAFDASHVELMERLAEPLALALANQQLYAQTRHMADSDALTDLPNHRRIQQLITNEIARSERHGHVCSVLVMDIDNFKVFNDNLGHKAGDDLLIRYAGLLRRTCRDTDVVARRSGDEFIVLLPETGPESAFSTAQRVHDALKAADWHYPGENSVAVTTSIGVAAFPHDAAETGELLSIADTAMYQAKLAGGGQTRIASDVVAEDPQDGPRQVRFGVLETLANMVAGRLAEAGDRMRTLAAFTARAAMQAGEALGLDEMQLRVLRIAALSHALGIYPAEDPDDHPEDVWGLDAALNPTYLKLGRLFTVASPGLDDAVHAVHYHHRPAEALGDDGTMRLAKILAVGEAFARKTMPNAQQQLSAVDALAELRGDASLDQSIVDALAGAMESETVGRAA